MIVKGQTLAGYLHSIPRGSQLTKVANVGISRLVVKEASGYGIGG
jgi:hypothetical protein